MKYKPVFEKQLYHCVVNGRLLFKKFHLSGLLFFKTLEDKKVHAVFQNEMGFTFFDFEWDANDSFKVNQVIPQLDKPALIKTLKKDLGLLLMKGLDKQTEVTATQDNTIYNRFTLEKGYAYYISQNGKLQRIENTGEKKKVTTIILNDKATPTAMPGYVLFNHHRAHFTITLDKIDAHADE